MPVPGSALRLLLGLVAVPLAAQLPSRGPVPRDTARVASLLAQVTVPDGFEKTLFAGPPVAMYPTCLTATLTGELYVCVDPNLSLSGIRGNGRVVRLTDDNRDGVADQYTVFAEMDSPRGLIHDGRTLYVMHPPDLTAWRDTDGDGIADVSEVLVRGIGVGLDVRTADHGTNGIVLGIDGWIYLAVGDYGFRDAVGRDGRRVHLHGGGIARVRTDGTGLEVVTEGIRNVYDIAVDPFLRIFARDNTNDGDGWDTRLHYLPPGAHLGYPTLYRNFSQEHFASLADYGGGSGTAGFWLQDPGFPALYANTLLTGDWAVNQVFRHPLTAVGASFTAGQERFIGIPHPTDLALDGGSHLYVASLAGGSYTYIGDSVGYVVRVTPTGGTRSVPPVVATMSDDALATLLTSGTPEHRVQAQRELLRRPVREATLRRLEQLMRDQRGSAEGRVAALFTLVQWDGARANRTLPGLTGAETPPLVRAMALRGLADLRLAGQQVSSAPFLAGLQATDGPVVVEAIAGAVHLYAVEAAPTLLTLAAGADRGLAHLATRALTSLRASTAALAVLDRGGPADVAAALGALQGMHDPTVVVALRDRLKTVSVPTTRTAMLTALARLYHLEAPWTGHWWGTRPSYIGPYFAPVTWEGSAIILPLLQDAVRVARADDSALFEGLVRNRVVPPGSAALLGALAGADSATRTPIHQLLVGQQKVADALLARLPGLTTRGSVAMRTGVAELLAAENPLPTGATALVRSAALDTLLDPDLRGRLLTAAAAQTDAAAAREVRTLLGQLTPTGVVAGVAPTWPSAIESAWRRFVGDRRRVQELPAFIALTRSATAGERVLGFAVLVQSVRGARPAAAVVEQVRPVLDEAWGRRDAAASLVDAIRIMGVENQYAERLEQWSRPAEPTVPFDWVPLFNGRNLEGWDIKFAGQPLGVNLNQTFRVEEGLLKVRYDRWSGFKEEFGHLVTKQTWSHYIVAVEYRFVGEQVAGATGLGWAVRNNGVMLHSQSAASMGRDQDFPISLEVQLLGGLGGGARPTANLCTPGTHVTWRDRFTTSHCIDSNSETYHGDQWVRVEVRVLGDSLIQHIVAGDTVLTYTKPVMGGGNANGVVPGTLIDRQPLTKGHIALQAESAPIDFRKVEIVNLSGCMDPASPRYRPWFVQSDPAACRRP